MKVSDELKKVLFQTWYGILNPVLKSEYFDETMVTIDKLYNTKEIFPPKKDVFRAFRLTSYKDFKILILGQDPYPSDKANGLAFSNAENTGAMSPSLRKIHEVIEDDYHDGLNLHFDQTLESWAKQGVMLLNTALTVEKGNAGSHLKYWKEFTIGLLKRLSEYNTGIIYVLWGKNAQEYEQYIDKAKNYIIKAEHPAASVYTNRKWKFSFKGIDEITKRLYGEEIKW